MFMFTAPTSSCLRRCAAVFAFGAWIAGAALAAPVATWTISSGTGAGLDTASPSFGSGSTTIRAAFAPQSLGAVGDSLVFSGTVTFVFPDATNGGDGSFRFGLFNANGSTNDNGWSGYLTANKYAGTVPLYEKDGGGGWTSTSNYAQVTSGITGGLSNYALSSGTYNLNLTLARVATGVAVSWSLVGTTNNYSLSGSWVDTAPSTYAFDRVAMQAVSNFGQTSMSFANLEVTYLAAVPEPASAALGLGGFALLVCLGRRRRRVA